MCRRADMGPWKKGRLDSHKFRTTILWGYRRRPCPSSPQHGRPRPVPPLPRPLAGTFSSTSSTSVPTGSTSVTGQSRERIREVAGSGRSSSLLNEKRFTAAVAAGARPVSDSELPPPRGGLAVSFSPETRGPGGGGLIGGAVRSSPSPPLPGDQAQLAPLRGCVLPACCHPEEETAQRLGRAFKRFIRTCWFGPMEAMSRPSRPGHASLAKK